MPQKKSGLFFVAALCWLGFPAQAASLLDEVRVVAEDEAAEALVPEPLSFTINADGAYTITLTDVSQQTGLGDPFTSLALAITQGHEALVVLAEPGSETVSLSAGSYQAQVLGASATSNSYAVRIENEAGVEVLDHSAAITASNDTDFSSLQKELSLVAGSTYTVTVIDRAFPAALSSIEWTIAQGANPVVCHTVGVGSCSFVASADGNTLIVLAAKGAGADAGMYSVKVVHGTTSQNAYAETHVLGEAPLPVTIDLPLTGTYSLVSNDQEFPSPLAAFNLLIVQDSEVRLQQTAPGTASFGGSAGEALLYVVAEASNDSASTYTVIIKHGATLDYSNIFSVTQDEEGGQIGYSFNVDVPSTGTYTLRLEDFNFPQSFTGLSAAVSQNGAVLDSLSAEGSLSIAAQAGALNVAVLAAPGSVGKGLFGVSMTASDADAPFFEATQGVGAAFTTTSLPVTASGAYRVNVGDLAVPAALNELLVALVRGSEVIGYIYGGGHFDFDATAGAYSLNALATTASGESFGMYGVNVTAAPTVIFNASATSVTRGGSVDVSWSSSDADTCAASGAWSGSFETSGSKAVGPVNANLALTLTCTGAGGSTAKTLNITAVDAASSGRRGGGALVEWWMAALGLLIAVQRRLNSRTDP